METNNKPEEKYKSYEDFENIIVSPPSKENIDRLIKQSQGDPSFFLLCMYSFIESYIRQNFPDYKYKEGQNKEDKVYFWMLINAIKNYHFHKHPEGFKIDEQVRKKFKKLYGNRRSFDNEQQSRIEKEVKEKKEEYFRPYNNTLNKIKSLKKISDRVRHNFETIPPEVVDIVIERFKSFAKFEGFITQEINNIPSIANWGSGTISEESTQLLSELQDELAKVLERNDNLKKVVENLRKQRDETQKEHEEQVEALQKDVETYLENTTILQAYTSAVRNYHTRILKLSPEQEQIIEDIFNELSKLDNTASSKDFLIKGGPGTGKTFVLIKLLEKIAAKKLNKKVRLLTYTDSLSKYNQYLSQEYEKKNPERTEHVTKFMKDNIQTFDSYFIPEMEKILGKSIYPLDLKNESGINSDKYQNIYSIFKKVTKEHADLSMKEAFNEIWTFSPTKEEFITKSYFGNNINLSEDIKENRGKIWDIVESVGLEIEKESSIPSDYAYYKISSDERYKQLTETDKIDFLFIDEIQDLSPAKIRVVSKLTNRACVMAGDLNQSVFIKRGLSWVELMDKLSNPDAELYDLEKNYRSTINIQNLANKYREMCDIKDDEAISKSFIPGQDPELSISENLEDALDKILTKIECYINVLNFNPEDICIVVPSNEELIRIKGLLHDHQLKAMAMVDPEFDFAKKNIIRLSTTKQVKGIDSPIVVLLLTENFTNPEKNGNIDSMTQMNSIYSCITRTMDLLYVQITKDALSENLENGENAITKLKKICNK